MGGNVIYNSLINKRSGLDRDRFGKATQTCAPLAFPIEIGLGTRFGNATHPGIVGICGSLNENYSV